MGNPHHGTCPCPVTNQSVNFRSLEFDVLRDVLEICETLGRNKFVENPPLPTEPSGNGSTLHYRHRSNGLTVCPVRDQGLSYCQSILRRRLRCLLRRPLRRLSRPSQQLHKPLRGPRPAQLELRPFSVPQRRSSSPMQMFFSRQFRWLMQYRRSCVN